MAKGVTISVTGAREIDQVLKNLPDAVSHKVMSAAHAIAAKPLVEREKSLAPMGPTGNLIESIGVIRSSFAKANEIGEVKVGPRKGGRYKGFAGHLVEYGTRVRKTKGRGKYKKTANRGTMKAKPFAEPAFIQTKDEVEKRIGTEVAKSLNRTMKRFLK